MFFNVYRRNVFQCSQQGAASPAGSSFSRLAGAPPGSEMEKVFIFTSGIKVVWGEFQGHFKFHFPKVNWWFFWPQKFQLTWFWKKNLVATFLESKFLLFFNSGSCWRPLFPRFSCFPLLASPHIFTRGTTQHPSCKSVLVLVKRFLLTMVCGINPNVQNLK